MEYLDAIPYLVFCQIIHLFIDIILLVYLNRFIYLLKGKK